MRTFLDSPVEGPEMVEGIVRVQTNQTVLDSRQQTADFMISPIEFELGMRPYSFIPSVISVLQASDDDFSFNYSKHHSLSLASRFRIAGRSMVIPLIWTLSVGQCSKGVTNSVRSS